MELVEVCRGNLIRQEIAHIVNDIQALKKEFTLMGFLWTNRSGNWVADVVAKLAMTSSLPRNWVTTPPTTIAVLLETETV